MALWVMEISDFLKIRIFSQMSQARPNWKKVDFFFIFLLSVNLA